MAAGAITGARRRFEDAVAARACALDGDARAALIGMLEDLRAEALANAAESYRRNKWMQHAYWRVVAVYAGHFRRLAKRAARLEVR